MRSILLVILTLSIAACNKEKDFDCFKSTGPVKTETRTLAPFTKIYLQDDINLVFEDSDIQKVEVVAGKHLLPKIETRVEGDSLILENRNYCNWVRSFKKEIKVKIYGNPGIKLYNNGYGKVSGKVSGDYFFVKSWSFENMELEVDLGFLWWETFKGGNSKLFGKVKEMEAFRHNIGVLDMRNMSYCGDLIYHDHGQGLSYIRSDSILTLRVYDSGSVEVYGHPQHTLVEKFGSGEVFMK